MTSVVASSSAGAIAAQLAPCDRLLIVAAAGLSIARDLPNNPYHNPADFRLHYPAAARAGYRTSYEAMGLYRDPRLSDGLRVGYLAQHHLFEQFPELLEDFGVPDYCEAGGGLPEVQRVGGARRDGDAAPL